jgi:AcrR family transcriptional regulator
MLALSSQDIVEAASGLFEKYGVKKTTMEDIAGATGMGKSSLYYYFKNKEAVYKAVLSSEMDEYHKQITEQLMSCDTAQEMIAAFIEKSYLILREFPNLLEILRTSDMGSNKSAIEIRERFEQWQQEKLTELLASGTRFGEFRPMTEGELEINVQAIGIAMYGLRLDLLNESNEKLYSGKIQSLINLLIKGIGGKNA